jgi:hypothetical protein
MIPPVVHSPVVRLGGAVHRVDLAVVLLNLSPGSIELRLERADPRGSFVPSSLEVIDLAYQTGLYAVAYVRQIRDVFTGRPFRFRPSGARA